MAPLFDLRPAFRKILNLPLGAPVVVTGGRRMFVGRPVAVGLPSSSRVALTMILPHSEGDLLS